MKFTYTHKRFHDSSLQIILQANEIIADYIDQGFTLTLRQLYYQFVARDLLPNTTASYKRLGGIISDGRLAGLIDWEAIEDRTREVRELSHWKSPAEIIETCVDAYHIDKWEGQKYRPEVWIEKDALVGVVEEVCQREDIALFSCRGYVSQSAMYKNAMRLVRMIGDGQIPVVLHFGDHDPSGLDMTRDIDDRLGLLTGQPVWVRRVALTMEQIEQFAPPPNPAKITDSRFRDYADRYGEDSWELDALSPSMLANLVRTHVEDLRDPVQWQHKVATEAEERETLRKVATRMETI